MDVMGWFGGSSKRELGRLQLSEEVAGERRASRAAFQLAWPIGPMGSSLFANGVGLPVIG